MKQQYVYNLVVRDKIALSESVKGNIGRKFLFFIIVFTYFQGSIIYSQKYTSDWTPKAIRIDGENSDWDGFSRFHNESLNISYDLKNDKTNLYLMVEVSDMMLQMNILQEGLSVSLKVKTQPVLLGNISFLPMVPEKTESGAPSKPPSDLTSIKTRMEGFKTNHGSIPEQGNKEGGIVYAINRDETGTLIYEICIPLEELFGRDYNFISAAGNNIVLNLSSNAFALGSILKPSQNKGSSDDEMSESTMGGEMSGRSMSGGMPGGGMAGGGMPGGMSGGMPGGTMAERNSSQKSAAKNMNFKFKLGLPRASSGQTVGFRG